MTSPPVRPPTPPSGSVDEVLARLDGLQDRPLHEHAEVYDEVHRRLQAQLAALDGV